MLRLDKSKILAWLRSPDEFKKIYVEKIKIEPNFLISKGSFIHKIAEEEMKKLKFIWANTRSKEAYLIQALNYLKLQMKSNIEAKGSTGKSIRNLYNILTNWFVKYPFYPLYIEHKFKWVDKESSVVWIGKPDAVVFSLKSDELIVVDFKVSYLKRRLNKCYSNLNVNSVELNYYVWLLNKLNINVTKSYIIPVDRSYKFISVEPEPNKFDSFLYSLLKNIRSKLKEWDVDEDTI